MKVGIVGWTSKQNAGDDAMALAFVSSVQEKSSEAEIVFFSDEEKLSFDLKEKKVKGLPGLELLMKIPYLRRFLFRQQKIKEFLNNEFDVIVFGGGSIFRNKKNIEKHLEISSLAKKLNCNTKLIAASISVGPFSCEKSKEICSKFLSSLDSIIVRDEFSIDLIREMGVNKPYFLYPDFALGYSYSSSKEKYANLKRNGERKTIAVSLRAGEKVNIQEDLVKQVSMLEADKWNIVFVAMSNNPKYSDDEFARRLAKEHLSQHTVSFVKYSGRLIELYEQIECSDIVIAVRLHAMIFSVALQKKVLYLPYQQKLTDFAKETSSGACVTLEEGSVFDIVNNYSVYLNESELAENKKLIELSCAGVSLFRDSL